MAKSRSASRRKPAVTRRNSAGRNGVSPGGTRRRRRSDPPWIDLNDEDLLELRFCDLGLKLEDTPLQGRIERLYSELEARGLVFRPHCWLSEEWFSEDSVPGIAIPFYLAHPRLVRLERRQMLEVEGGNEPWCMRILRHEAGHCYDTAYRLHRRRRWREVFGPYSQPYPEYYQPKPYSKSYVLHLDAWYAQSHPAEDFAETFAVWLKPRSPWRTRYQGWPAMKKLRYVNELMHEVRGQKAAVRSRRKVSPLREIRKTLGEHYREKRGRYGLDYPNFYDRDLRKLFAEPTAVSQNGKRSTAAAFLRRMRPELRRVVSHWTGEYRYTIDQVLGEMIDRCHELNLQLDKPEPQARRDALVMLTMQTMNYLHGGRHRLAL